MAEDFKAGNFQSKAEHQHVHEQHHHHQHTQEQQLLPEPSESFFVSFLAMLKMPNAILITCICILLSLCYVFRQRIYKFIPFRIPFQKMPFRMPFRAKPIKRTILICGPTDSGKTLLFYTLLNGKFQLTQASLEENVDTFNLHSGVLKDYTKDKAKLTNVKFEFIDCPGQSSHELKLFKYVPRTNAAIVLVDAASDESCIQGAKLLYSLLENKAFADRHIPVLVCSNKADLPNVQSMPAVRDIFLKELNNLKNSQTTMGSIETNEKAERMQIGKSGEELRWDSFASPISFGQISVKDGNLRDVLDFLEAIPC